MTELKSFHKNSCYLCESKNIESILYLTHVPSVNELLSIETCPDIETRYPLELCRCVECGLVQSGFELDRDLIFPKTYPYLTGNSGALKKNFQELASQSFNLLNIDENDLIVDIGSNDGTLLTNYLSRGCQVLGVEPTDIADIAVINNIPTEKAFFNHSVAQKIRESRGNAKVIAATNVLAHAGDIISVMEGIKELLTKDGALICETHYLYDMIKTLQYDKIYHDHLRFFSVGSFQKLCQKVGLEVFYAEKIESHGGSIRIYAGQKGAHKIHLSVAERIGEENEFGLNTSRVFFEFSERVTESKLKLLNVFSEIKFSGKKIYGVGAPARGTTLINTVGIDHSMMNCVLELSSSKKLNSFVPGTRIPILDEKLLFGEDQPDYLLMLSWHIADFVIPILKKNGYRGKFIVPLPEPRVVD
tara:strand:+ start:4459 stop:5709 length:1251 start_codon:yes stop_codon:yes gene_type:complete